MIKNLARIIPQKDSRVFWLSFFLCLFFCGLILFVVSPITGLSKNFGADNDGYIQLARSIVKGDGYVFEQGGPKVFHRPPLYPVFLLPAAIFPENLQRYIIVILQSVLVGFVGMFIFKMAKKLYNQNVAVIALVLFLVNPWVYWNAKNPMTPILQMFLYLIFSYLAMIELSGQTDSRPLRQGLIIGVAGAALSLTHAAMLPVVLMFIAVLFVISFFKHRKNLLKPFIAVITLICFIAPWTYRNWTAFGEFLPVSGGGGLAYFNGNVHWDFVEDQPQKRGESYIDASLRVMGIDGTEKTVTHWKGFRKIEDENLANEKMTEHIKNHPELFIKKAVFNAVEYYFPVFTKHFLAVKSVTVEQWALSIFHLFLWILTVIGVLYYWRSSILLLAGIFFYSIWYFPFATFIGHSLYTMGTIPFLCILAASGLVCFFKEKQYAH
ncbi:MAG: glycosyltransferase family 39 protein [Sedimentisphaerales bacterium]|nr:glycosyltransferase family 39 protein [Sedimentisphaerales bacterium]